MKIAICDDEKIFLDRLEESIYNYSNKYNWESVVDKYNGGKILLQSNIQYDIIVLDYQMDELDGLETARLLRQGKNSNACIIFLTSYKDVAIPAYEVDTFRFVLKSTLPDGLIKALDDYRKSRAFDRSICIKVDRELVTVNTDSIVYIEVLGKECFIKIIDSNTLVTRATLQSILKQLPDTEFFRIHKSYVVNFKHISKRDSSSVTMKNCDSAFPISRNYSKKFKDAYYKYLKDRI